MDRLALEIRLDESLVGRDEPERVGSGQVCVMISPVGVILGDH